MLVTKRTGATVPFDAYKIENAIQRGLKKIGVTDTMIPKIIADEATIQIVGGQDKEVIHVDDIHKIVENVIMSKGLHDLAREYITYRFQNKQSVFKKRANLKPYEYPELIEYVNAIRHSYWIHTELNFLSDVADLKVYFTQGEARIIKRGMLAIAQIELQVKTFWAKIGDRLPKPEIQASRNCDWSSDVCSSDLHMSTLS